MKIEIAQLTPAEQQAKGIAQWPIWTKEASQFEWYYDSTEECYLLEGQVTVYTNTETVEFQAGDYVIFPAGLRCKWHIHKAVRKHYNFR